MLVLTRKVGDVIAIGDNIKIVVMAIKGKQVRLGVQADRNTVVHREEIYQKIQQEIKAAMQSDMGSTSAAGELLRNVQSGDSSASNQPSENNAPSQPRKTEAGKLSSSGASGPQVIRRVEIRRANPPPQDDDGFDAPEKDPKPSGKKRWVFVLKPSQGNSDTPDINQGVFRLFSSRVTSPQFQKTKEAYKRYIATYRQLNKGSTEGALNFFQFFYYLNYTCRYSDPRSCVPIGYR